MINPKYPLVFYNSQQEFFLEHLAQNNKEYYTLKFSHGNAVYLYYDLQVNSSVYDYREWLHGIKNAELRNNMQSEGFEKCLHTDLFIQFMRKKRNITENDFIKEKMGHKEYSRYNEFCIE